MDSSFFAPGYKKNVLCYLLLHHDDHRHNDDV